MPAVSPAPVPYRWPLISGNCKEEAKFSADVTEIATLDVLPDTVQLSDARRTNEEVDL